MPMSDLLSQPIRFFCLNLRFGLADDGADSWTYRKQCYPSLLEHHPCDFYGFQEANDFQITYLQGELTHHDTIGQRIPAPDNWQHNIIFHHRSWKCLSSDHFYLSRTPDVPSKYSRSKWPRQCTMGVFQRGDIRLAVINTHFDFDPEIQRRSARLILERVNRDATGLPVVFMGDLNAGPDAGCIEELTRRSSGFKSALPQPSGGTHHGFTGVAQGPCIDWIFYRGGLERADAAIVTERYDGRYPSDHFPLTASFSVIDPPLGGRK